MPFEITPKMNHVKLIHEGLVNRDRTNMSLLDVACAGADARGSIELEAAYKSF